MNLKNLRRISLAVSVIVLASACTDGSEARFVGQWHRATYPKENIVIKSEGGSRISLTGNPWPTGTLMGRVDGDTVTFDQFTTASFKKDGTLVFAGVEFVK